VHNLFKKILISKVNLNFK